MRHRHPHERSALVKPRGFEYGSATQIIIGTVVEAISLAQLEQE